jgi:hypothetical protein
MFDHRPRVRPIPESQVMTKPKQVRRNLPKSAPSRQQSKPIRIEHGQHISPGRLIGPLLMPGIAGLYDWPDSSLARFIVKFIAAHGVCFPDGTGTSAELDLAECVVIARTVLKSPAWDIFTFPLPGLAGQRPVTLDDTMHYLAIRWHEHNVEWKRRRWIHGSKFEQAQMDVVCETILVRAGVLESMLHETRSHRDAAKHYGEALKVAWSELVNIETLYE